MARRPGGGGGDVSVGVGGGGPLLLGRERHGDEPDEDVPNAMRGREGGNEADEDVCAAWARRVDRVAVFGNPRCRINIRDKSCSTSASWTKTYEHVRITKPILPLLNVETYVPPGPRGKPPVEAESTAPPPGGLCVKDA